MTGKKIQNWAFVAPKMSRDLSEYFEGILDFIKDDPSVFLHAFTFDDPNIAMLADMDGIISYTVPPPDVMKVFNRRQPPIVAITMCRTTDPKICCAHIVKRNCLSYAFCSSHAPHFTDESSALLKAYRRQVFARTGQMPRLFRPISTMDINLIETEVERFTAWCAKVPKPCGMFVHGDDVARKMLDTCRLKGIKVPDELRVVGTGNSPSVRDIAFHLNVSIRKIENDFAAIYGHTLRDEIAAQRLDLVCTALRTSNEPIKALVSRAGFGNMSQATRAFKSRFGLTMNEYRASL